MQQQQNAILIHEFSKISLPPLPPRKQILSTPWGETYVFLEGGVGGFTVGPFEAFDQLAFPGEGGDLETGFPLLPWSGLAEELDDEQGDGEHDQVGLDTDADLW